MEKQIREIIAQHVGGTYETKQKCAKEILRLFGVVGRSEPFCPNCYSRNIIAWGPGADKCTDCEYVWDV